MKKVFITIITTLLPLMANAAIEYYGIWYNLNASDKTAEVVASQGTQYSGDISISYSVYYGNQSYTVKSIGNSAFEGCVDVTTVSIPSSVTSIGNGAFYYCTGLKCVAIPNGVTTIGEGAFSKCYNLKSVGISQSVISIAANAFYECQNLVQVISLIQNPSDINENAFNTYATTTLYVPSGKVSAYGLKKGWKKFTNITDGISEDPTKRTIHLAVAGTLPYFISYDEKYQIEELILSGELNGTDFYLIRDMAGIRSRVGSGGLRYDTTGGKLKSLDISNAAIVEGGSYYMEAEWTSSGFTCIECSDELYTKDNCVSRQLFYKTNLESIIIPNNITSIEKMAFGSCTKLLSIIIPKNVTSIGEWAFENCIKLTSITIPNNVTSIGESVFYGCSNLGLIVVETGGNTKYDSRNNCNAIIETSSNTLIAGCKNTIIINSVSTIGNNAFSGCSLNSITIPNSVTTIGNGAFSGCSGLNTVVSEIENPFAIDENVFYYYNKDIYATATLIVPSGKKSAYQNMAGWSKFQNIVEVGEGGIIGYEFEVDGICYKIGENNTVSVIQRSQKYSGDLVIPSHVSYNGVNYSVTTIASMAFANYCSELTSITIPPTVTSIESGAFFDYLINLKAVHITDLKAWCNIDYGNYPDETCPLWYARHLYLNGEEIKDLVIPSDVTSVNKYAFAYCSGLTSVTIPNNVTSIGECAFHNCSNLTSIISLKSLPPLCSNFGNVDVNKCIIWVQKGCLVSYKDADGWKNFNNIRELNLGDVNLDLEVNKTDLNALVAYILGEAPENFNKAYADLNGDDKVNAADVVKLVTILNIQDGLSTDWQFNYNSSQVVSSLNCTLNNNGDKTIQLTKCELYCNQKIAGSANFNVTLGSGGNKSCTFSDLSSFSTKTGFSVVWYYTYNGESYTYRCDLTE